MIIIGNGVDIVENRRIFTAIKKKEFIRRIFSKPTFQTYIKGRKRIRRFL